MRKYRSEEKPPKEKDYKKIIALREAINQFNETQKRKPFVPEEGSAEAVFEEEWEKLQEAVLQYEEDLREEIRRLLELENLVQHFNVFFLLFLFLFLSFFFFFHSIFEKT